MWTPGLAFSEILHLQLIGSALAPPRANQRRRHQYQAHLTTFWAVTKKPMDRLELLTPKMEINMFQLSIGTLVQRMPNEKHIENRVRKVTI